MADVFLEMALQAMVFVTASYHCDCGRDSGVFGSGVDGDCVFKRQWLRRRLRW